MGRVPAGRPRVLRGVEGRRPDPAGEKGFSHERLTQSPPAAAWPRSPELVAVWRGAERGGAVWLVRGGLRGGLRSLPAAAREPRVPESFWQAARGGCGFSTPRLRDSPQGVQSACVCGRAFTWSEPQLHPTITWLPFCSPSRGPGPLSASPLLIF